MANVTYPKITGIFAYPDPTGHAGEALYTDGNSIYWSAASAAGWELTGNSGTTAGTNFIGTTDDVDVSFKRNSVEVIRIGGESRVGVQTSTPQNPLHINASVGATINSVVTASVTTANQTLNTSPTGTIDLIAEFGAVTLDSISQVTGSGGYTANGQTIDYQIYQAILANGTYYKSSVVQTGSFTDTVNDGMTNFELSLTFSNIASNCDYFYIEKQINGGGFGESAIVASSSTIVESNFTGTQSASTWPVFYTLSYTVPTAGSGITGQEINIGFGNYTESGINYLCEIRSATNIGGIYYCEQTGTSGNFTDANMSNTFDLQWDWTAGTGTDQVIRMSSDGGSNWTYLFVGGMSGSFVFNGQSNDSIAETAWSNDISGAQIQYAFKCFAKTTAPSGNIVYTPSSNTYYATITTPNVYYIFKHNLSGLSSPWGKIIADYNVGVSYGKEIVDSTYLDTGYTSWVDGTSLTPTTFAFGSGTTRYFKLVGFNGTIYSGTPLVVNATTSGSQYFTGSFSYPSGITIVKILVSTDGVTYTGSKTLNSPTTTFTLDPTDNSFSGSTTITPTSLVPTGARIDRNQTSLTDVPHLAIVDNSNTGTRYMSLGFGVASSVTGAPSILSNLICTSSTGYLSIGTGRLSGYTNASQNSEAWRLGNDYAFNLNRSSSIHFTYYGVTSGADPMYIFSAGDSNRGTVYFGQATTSFGSASKVVIAPTAGGTIGLHFRRSTESADNILFDTAGSFKAGWNSTGRLYLNSTSYSGTTWLLIGGTNSGSQIRLGAGGAGTGSVDGDIWNDNSNKAIKVYSNGIAHTVTGGFFAQTSSVTVGNTTTETTVTSTGQGTLTLPANFFTVGKTLEYVFSGFYTTTGTPTLNFKFKYGSTVYVATGTVTLPAIGSNSLFVGRIKVTCRTVGASGTIFVQGYLDYRGTTVTLAQMVSTSAQTINTTTTQAATLTAQWGTANVANTLTLTNFNAEGSY